MSVTRILGRMAIVLALRGKTMAGDNVRDSLIGGIDTDADGRLNIGEGETRPFIAVYSDGSKSTPDGQRRMHEGGVTEFVIEWGIAAGMADIDPESGEPLKDKATGKIEIVAGIPDTDDGMEFTLDLIGCQIVNALTEPDSEWADIWRDVSSGGIVTIERQRATSGDKSRRMAAHQMRISAKLMDDPVIGEEIPDPLPRVFALLDGMEGGDYAVRSALIQASITGTSESWKAVQRRLGLSAIELGAMGIAPLATDEEGVTPDLGSVALDFDTHGEEQVLP